MARGDENQHTEHFPAPEAIFLSSELSLIANGLQLKVITEIKHELRAVSYYFLGDTKIFWFVSEIY